MRVNLSLEEVYGRRPQEVEKLLCRLGIDLVRPYRANITFSGICIEQEDAPVPAVC
ncbi:hypothetical protein [Desulfuromonas sp.]|uniref:hypothetical protein n=1 Tax=Desulfuromonas sp. TaxID=892 RepID=UPI0025BA47B5|nr:hypothetical protein [Desulfuromonas sp.]